MVDPAQLAQGADQLRAALRPFRNQDDVRLVMDPRRSLTPVLTADLERAAERSPWIALFFDTYERTGPLLDAWLRDLRRPPTAICPEHVVTAAGRAPSTRPLGRTARPGRELPLGRSPTPRRADCWPPRG